MMTDAEILAVHRHADELVKLWWNGSRKAVVRDMLRDCTARSLVLAIQVAGELTQVERDRLATFIENTEGTI